MININIFILHTPALYIYSGLIITSFFFKVEKKKKEKKRIYVLNSSVFKDYNKQTSIIKNTFWLWQF